MRKLKECLLILIFGMLLISGCGAKIPDMTKDQMSEIGEYAAIQMMKYDANNRSRLVDKETIEEADRRKEQLEALKQQQEQKEEEKKKQQEAANKDKEDKEKQESVEMQIPTGRLEDFYTFPEGVSVNYEGFAVLDSYPEVGDDDFFILEATENKKLLVLKFDVINSSANDQSMDFFGYNASYRITVNGENTRGILTTMLMDDLATFSGILPAQSTKQMVLVTEFDSEILQNVTQIRLRVKNASNECTIQLN